MAGTPSDLVIATILVRAGGSAAAWASFRVSLFSCTWVYDLIRVFAIVQLVCSLSSGLECGSNSFQS